MNPQTLERIATALETIAGLRPKPELGFCEMARQLVYIDNNGDSPWYFLNGDAQQPIKQNALIGTVTNVELRTVEVRGERKEKLEVSVQADKLYVLRTGFGTTAFRKLLLCLAQIKDFSVPVKIGARPGEERVVLISVFQNGQAIFVSKEDWGRGCDWRATVNGIRQRLGLKVQSVQTPSPVNPATGEVEISGLIARTDMEMERVGWSREMGRDFIEQAYGKSSRHELSDEELMEFLTYLQGVVTPEPEAAPIA